MYKISKQIFEDEATHIMELEERIGKSASKVKVFEELEQ